MASECACGGDGCLGVDDGERHQCGGPGEACAAPGCRECGTPAGTLTDAEIDAADETANDAFSCGNEWRTMISALARTARAERRRAEDAERERDAAKAVADAWATWYAARGAADVAFGKARRGGRRFWDARDVALATLDAASANLRALGVTL